MGKRLVDIFLHIYCPQSNDSDLDSLVGGLSSKEKEKVDNFSQENYSTDCIIDIADVNCFILFQQHCKNNPDLLTLKQHSWYSVLDFREELIRNIIGLENILNLLPLAFIYLSKTVPQSTFHNFLIKKGIAMYAIVKIKKN